MPCGRCGSWLIPIKGSPKCPDCDHLPLVPPNDAAKILAAITRTEEAHIMDGMRIYSRDQILETAFEEREETARRYVCNFVPIDARMVVGCTAIIKKLHREKIVLDGTCPSRYFLPDLIHKFGTMVLKREHTADLEARTWSMLHMEEYDLDHLAAVNPDDFPVYPNEKYVRAFAARSSLGMMTQSQAEQRAGDPEYDGEAALGTKKILSVAEAVPRFYYQSYLFADMFFGNAVRREHCVPPYLGQTKILPLELKKFIWMFTRAERGFITCDAARFDELARQVFGDRHSDFEHNFVASAEHPEALPVFLRMSDRVLVSQFFGDFYTYSLLPIMHKREFETETQRRSLVYESTIVPAHFKKNGFEYYANQGVKNVRQIDGIAVSDTVAYVIETKYWNPRKFLGSARRYDAHDDLVKSSIDGTHVERATGEVSRRGVSLADKAKWVEERRNDYKIPDGAPIKCMLVTNTLPIISRHAGCEIALVRDPDALDSQGGGVDNG